MATWEKEIDSLVYKVKVMWKIQGKKTFRKTKTYKKKAESLSK